MSKVKVLVFEYFRSVIAQIFLLLIGEVSNVHASIDIPGSQNILVNFIGYQEFAFPGETDESTVEQMVDVR